MHPIVYVIISLALPKMISGKILQDNGVIIGSSLGGFVALIILILDLIVIFELLTTSGRGVCSKLIWILIIIFFPIAGLIIYWCCARRRTVDQVV